MQFPPGKGRSSQTAPLPAHVQGHFGAGLRSYVLYQHHQNGVTQPLIREELRDLGIDISTGQIDRLLTEGHQQFHEGKDALLPAAREVSSYFQADDTGARHLGKNADTTVIANPLIASFTTTGSKSRVNFLKLLRVPAAIGYAMSVSIHGGRRSHSPTRFPAGLRRLRPHVIR